MNDTTSILELFNQLCDIHLGPPKRVYRVQPAVSRATSKKHLKRTLFNVLFRNLFSEQREHFGSSGTDSQETEGILLQISKFRKHKLTQEANRLDSLFSKLRADGNDDVRQCLRFLVALKDCGNSPISDRVQEGTLCVPSFDIKDEDQVPDQGPLSYRMGMVPSNRGTHFYHQYSTELFESFQAFNLREDERTVSWVFNSTPGYGISEESILTSTTMDGKSSLSSVCGSVSDEKFGNMNVQLDLPDFQVTPNFRIPELKCSKSRSFTQFSEADSGQSSMSGSVVSVVDQAMTMSPNDSIWENAVTEVRSKNYTWEWIGFQSGPIERPYLTEAGRLMFDAVIRHRLYVVSSIADSDSIRPPLIPVDSKSLTKHVLLMLVGVPSWMFPFDQESHSFHITPGLHISGVSPEMLASAATPFIQFGTSFHRLAHFARPAETDNSFYTNGLIFEAFTVAIRNVLSHYSAFILQIPSTLTLLQAGTHLHAAMEQIGYLARLCQVHDKPPPRNPQTTGFPMGMKLLTYLYREAQDSSCCGHYPALLTILNNTWTPFMLFVKDWVFHGIHNDKYKEFMIDVDCKSLEKRDADYWDGAYNLSQSLATLEGLPDFLQTVIKDIVICGKSINLIRLCNPQHFLCSLSDSVIPSVGISFSQTDLTSMEQYCQMYVQRMQQIARSISEDRLEARKREKREKKELKETAKKVADDEIARLQGIIDERKRKLDVKKRKEFKRLKEQMVSDLERRTEEDEQAKEEDRQFMARLAREEDALTQEEIELEARARDELIAYYGGLTEEAMHRERKALWRVQRARLDTARTQFLMEESQRWEREMEELTQGKKVLDSVDSGSIPKWADRSSKELTIVVEDKEEEVELPHWARQELDSTKFSPTALTTEGLPDWAVRGMDKITVEVNESGEENDGEEKEDAETEAEPSKFARQFQAVQLGGPAQQKPQIKVSDQLNSMKETTELESQAHIRNVEGKHVSSQSDQSEGDSKSCIKKVHGGDILKQTEEQQEKIHIKKSETMQATTESQEKEEKASTRMQDGQAVNTESTEERQVIPKRGRLDHAGHITKQTESQVWALRKQSIFGHVSQLSKGDSNFGIPTLRRNPSQHASVESDFKDFGIKPRIRMNAKMSATVESTSNEVSNRPRIRFNSKQYANLESDQVDHHQLAMARFKQRNIKGHASDSTVQQLLYGVRKQEEKENQPLLPKVELITGNSYEVEPYTPFFHLDVRPNTDLMSSTGPNYHDSSSLSEEEVEAYKYRPLSSLLARAISSPVRAQISLINNAIVNYFTSELKVEAHFAAIRRYVFMADGDFAQILSDILNEKLATKPLPKEILNPVFLKGALTKAVRSSMHSDDPYAQKLSFRLVSMPSVLAPNEPQSLRCLDLKYTVEWPLNIVFTESCMVKYSLVFAFLLQIKRVVWNLKDVWHRLKRDALIGKAGNSPHFVQLQLHRQEMEHFVKMLQGYVTNQVIHVTWQELQTALAGDIGGLDELKALHETYLQKAVCRCLLEKRASRVMQIILNIFCLILKFRTQLLSSSWQQNKHGQIIHPSFSEMVETYKSFHAHSLFLFKVVNVLSQKGYQPHLQELLMQLNFNDFYTEAAK